MLKFGYFGVIYKWNRHLCIYVYIWMVVVVNYVRHIFSQFVPELPKLMDT